MTKWNRTLWLWGRQLFKGDRYRMHGVDITVPASVDPEIRYLLARKRPYEEPEARFVRAHLSPGTHVVELGGSIGVVSALVRKSIGPDARQIIVEANPALAKICKANAERYANAGRVDVVEAAIDYSGAPEVFFDFGHNAHTGHVAKSGVPVPTTTLANVAAPLPDGPRALVCDIEGAEIDLIEAEKATLNQFDVIILETHPGVYANGQRSLDTMLGTLEGCGFERSDAAEDVVVYSRRTA